MPRPGAGPESPPSGASRTDLVVAAAGKAIASRNALRHGLSAIINRQSAPSAVIERLALAICDQDRDEALLGDARFMQAWLAHREIEALVPIVREKYKDQIPRPAKSTNEFAEELETGMIPIGIKALLTEEPVSVEAKHNAVDVARKLINAQER